MLQKKFSWEPDTQWTLFLDRDGVINERLPDEYVLRPEQFIFCPGAVESIGYLSQIFGRIVVVTNQQGIGKGYMTEDDLTQIHDKMLSAIQHMGGRIDKIYYAPHMAIDNNFFRKPSVGMALKARKDFPEIQFKKSIMVGDTISDMIFGKRAGMKTALVNEDKTLITRNHELIDLRFDSLEAFARFLGL